MKFDDLVIATGVAPRQIRYLIAEGFCPPPTGGRTYATYGQAHVTAITRYERLRDLGFPPAAIRLLLNAREGIPVPVVDGVTLIVAPELIGSGADPAPMLEAIRARLGMLLSREAADAG
jgi:MerR family copper efflux transcriptional regulator